jgi:hypothetical protein
MDMACGHARPSPDKALPRPPNAGVVARGPRPNDTYAHGWSRARFAGAQKVWGERRKMLTR